MAILRLRRPSLIRRQRRLIVQLLSLAFLFAQLGMAVHASSHLKAEPHGALAQVCGQCASFAPLQNMVGGGVIVIQPVAVFHDRAVAIAATSVASRGTSASFRSRAPPVSC
ncbi:MAG TPA: hypothetical protein VFZ95_02945 [Steroidobacteraceae bacterium]